MLGFKTFHCARILLAAIKLAHMTGKNQTEYARGIHPSSDNLFFDLAT
jgi:hypothetical protein